MTGVPNNVGARLKSAKQERGQIERQATALLATVEARGTEMTDAERELDDRYAGALARLNGQIAELEAFLAPKAQPATRTGGRRFAEMFGAYAINDGGWRSEEDFFAAIHSGLSDPRLQFLAAGSTSGSAGGFSVPTQFLARWLDESLEGEIVRPRCEIRPMTSDTAIAAGWDGGTHTSTLFGGFTANWIPQGTEFSAEDPAMRIIGLHAHKLGLLTQVNNELLADGVGYGEQLSAAMPRAMGWNLDYAFLNGHGAGQPLGVINANATVVVSKEGSQTAATINYTNLLKMFARMHPASVGNSVWVANPTTIPQLGALTVTVSSGGSHIPVITESNGQFRILTRPVIFTEKVPVLGTKGDIGLYDFSGYVVGLRQDMSLERSQHVGFTRDSTYYRGILRADGQPKLASAITPKHGDTLSPFVVLETRA